MVELVEVEDESFETKQAGPDDDDYYTDTGMPNQTSIKHRRFPI
jgi:import receptor subunit TOM22